MFTISRTSLGTSTPMSRACELLLIGYEEYEAAEYALAACYLPRTRASAQLRMNGSGTATPTGRQATKWWADGEEPIYYVVSPKVLVHSNT